MKKHKIMFVCLGNICRSPMAELLLKDMVKKLGREEEFYIESSATSDENVWNGVGAPVYPQIRSLLESKGISCAGKGSPVYPPVRELLEKKGISCTGKYAQVLKKEHGEEFDLFLCMDDNNVRNARRILGEKHADKCQKLLSFAGESGNVADPWYTRDFEQAYEDRKRGLEGLLQTL